tara:strand:+ start:1750 stop:2274 length:525 start_codon:yes stop_codon:yes gene_type:complete
MMLTNAIVMHTKPILEKDLLVELFTEELGRIRVFAKYAQSKKPRFGGQLNTLNLISTSVMKRGTAFHLGQTSVQERFDGVKKSYEKMHVAYQFLHVIRSVTQMNHENKPIFTALTHYLESMDNIDQSQLKEHKYQFYHQVLQIEGVMLESSKFNENEIVKMIESYTSINLKDVL